MHNLTISPQIFVSGNLPFFKIVKKIENDNFEFLSNFGSNYWVYSNLKYYYNFNWKQNFHICNFETDFSVHHSVGKLPKPYEMAYLVGEVGGWGSEGRCHRK